MRWLWILAAWPVLAETPAVSPREVMRQAMEKQRAAAERQRESIRKQAENLGVSLGPSAGSSVAATDPEAIKDPAPIRSGADFPCEPLASDVISPLIESAAKAQALAPKLLRAVIEQESAYRPCAVSSKGAKGLMQLMPDTAQDLGVDDAFDPRQNVDAGAKYLKTALG